MNDIAIYRGIIDACCFIIGYLPKLQYDGKAEGQICDLLSTIAHVADSFEREEVDKMFKPKDSE